MKGKFLSALLYPALLLALTSCGIPSRGPAETDSPKAAESTETAAADTETAETNAADTEAAETHAADTETAETHAADTEAAETNAAITETATADTEATETNAAITETAAADTEAAETHAADTEAAETHAADTEAAEASQPATLSIGYADDALLSQPDACERFSVSDSEWAVNAVLSTDVTVRDFKVLAIAMREIGEDGVMSFDLSEELYSLEELSPEKPLVLSTEFAGMVPTIGISYRDTDGTERFYALSMSGENSDLLLLDANI